MPDNQLVMLLDLIGRARAASNENELAFLAVNDTRQLTRYRQAALWLDGGIRALSGVVQPEANAPYAHWLNRVRRQLQPQKACALSSADLAPEERAEWAEWFPEHAVWLPFHESLPSEKTGGLLLAGEQAWTDGEISLLREWTSAWQHACEALRGRQQLTWRARSRRLAGWLFPAAGQAWWRQRRILMGLVILAVLSIPVRLTVLAPAELVPASPVTLRAPLDGVIGQFHVRPNEVVKAGQPLFSFDEAAIAARLEVATQSLAAAEAEYRQFAQQALLDGKSKSQLSILLGRIEEKRAEAEYLGGQRERARVLAPQDGIVLFDDAGEWTGRPVQTGERIMRIAAPGDVEVEAWIGIGDAIPLPQQAEVRVYLASSPLSSLSARTRHLAYDSIARPDGSYAYRLRASLGAGDSGQVGLKGTARIHGEQVPLIYWIMRRPLAAIRQTLGL